MRPYRGLTKDGKWVYGWYVYRGCVPNDTHYIYSGGFHHEILPETVGQDTGEHELYESKAKIWTGDIVQFSYVYGFIGNLQTKEVTGPIRFASGQYWVGKYSLMKAIEEDGHVIGNIHENPELLKD